MIQKKLGKAIIYIITMIIVILGLTNNIVNAIDTSGRTVKLDYYRYKSNGSGGYTDSGVGYAITENGSTNPHPIYQILSVNDNNKVLGIDYYCLNAEVGATWNNAESGGINQSVEYTKGYDLVNEKDKISTLSNTYNKVVSNNSAYKSIMWILDNMYTNSGSQTVEGLLEDAGIVYDSEYNIRYYKGTTIPFSNAKKRYDHLNQFFVDGYSTIMTPELVQSVQQAALWYFTNCDQSSFNQFIIIMIL